MSSSPSEQQKKHDWSATQYLKFGNQRTRPVYDLLSQVKPHITTPNPRIYDLGCGPGNSTEVLLDAYPNARITGVDSSPDMLEKAQASLPDIAFQHADLQDWEPENGGEGIDLLFSNAVLHWLRSPKRIPTIVRLFSSLPSGGVIAFQVPDNYHAPSHKAMRITALQPNASWTPSFQPDSTAGEKPLVGNLEDESRPDLDPIDPPATFYDALSPYAKDVNVWRTEYQHVLAGPREIVEWVKGSGLQPYLQRIDRFQSEDAEQVKEAFLKEYERKIGEAYGTLSDGRVMLGYPRLFVVAVRK